MDHINNIDHTGHRDLMNHLNYMDQAHIVASQHRKEWVMVQGGSIHEFVEGEETVPLASQCFSVPEGQRRMDQTMGLNKVGVL